MVLQASGVPSVEHILAAIEEEKKRVNLKTGDKEASLQVWSSRQSGGFSPQNVQMCQTDTPVVQQMASNQPCKARLVAVGLDIE